MLLTDLDNMESTEIGLKLSRQSWAPSLKRGVTHAIFHLVGKQPLCIDKLINLVNGCTKTGETSFKTFTLISSAPVAFEDDKLSINFCVILQFTGQLSIGTLCSITASCHKHYLSIFIYLC